MFYTTTQWADPELSGTHRELLYPPTDLTTATIEHIKTITLGTCLGVSNSCCCQHNCKIVVQLRTKVVCLEKECQKNHDKFFNKFVYNVCVSASDIFKLFEAFPNKLKHDKNHLKNHLKNHFKNHLKNHFKNFYCEKQRIKIFYNDILPDTIGGLGQPEKIFIIYQNESVGESTKPSYTLSFDEKKDWMPGPMP